MSWVDTERCRAAGSVDEESGLQMGGGCITSLLAGGLILYLIANLGNIKNNISSKWDEYQTRKKINELVDTIEASSDIFTANIAGDLSAEQVKRLAQHYYDKRDLKSLHDMLNYGALEVHAAIQEKRRALGGGHENDAVNLTDLAGPKQASIAALQEALKRNYRRTLPVGHRDAVPGEHEPLKPEDVVNVHNIA